MAEWGVTFDYIENNWTDRQFVMMLNCLGERRKAMNKRQTRAPAKPGEHEHRTVMRYAARSH